MSRANISSSVLRRLYAYSGNNCAFEGCNLPIFESNGLLTGECAHIKAYSPGGKRYDPAQTDKDRNDYDNLVLLCSRHHTIIDSDSTFTVERLLNIKQNHEREYDHSTFEASEKMLTELRLRQSIHKDKLRVQNSGNNEYKISIDVKANILDIYKTLCELIDILIEQADFLGFSENNCYPDLELLFDKLGIDKNILDTIPYYENPFINRGWEIFNLGISNSTSSITLELLHLKVKILEMLSEKYLEDEKYLKQLTDARIALEEYHKDLSYYD